MITASLLCIKVYIYESHYYVLLLNHDSYFNLCPIARLIDDKI